MTRLRFFAVLFLCTVLVSAAGAVDPNVQSASGTVVKANADVLLVRPRGGKALSLKIHGTTKVTLLSYQKREGKTVAVQREGDVKNLQPEQSIAVLYTNLGDELVLLHAVALPAGDK